MCWKSRKFILILSQKAGKAGEITLSLKTSSLVYYCHHCFKWSVLAFLIFQNDVRTKFWLIYLCQKNLEIFKNIISIVILRCPRVIDHYPLSNLNPVPQNRWMTILWPIKVFAEHTNLMQVFFSTLMVSQMCRLQIFGEFSDPKGFWGNSERFC